MDALHLWCARQGEQQRPGVEPVVDQLVLNADQVVSIRDVTSEIISPGAWSLVQMSNGAVFTVRGRPNEIVPRPSEAFG